MTAGPSPLIGRTLRGNLSGRAVVAPLWKVTDVRVEPVALSPGRFAEFAYLERLNEGAKGCRPGAVRRVAVSALGSYAVVPDGTDQ